MKKFFEKLKRKNTHIPLVCVFFLFLKEKFVKKLEKREKENFRLKIQAIIFSKERKRRKSSISKWCPNIFKTVQKLLFLHHVFDLSSLKQGKVSLTSKCLVIRVLICGIFSKVATFLAKLLTKQ